MRIDFNKLASKPNILQRLAPIIRTLGWKPQKNIFDKATRAQAQKEGIIYLMPGYRRRSDMSTAEDLVGEISKLHGGKVGFAAVPEEIPDDFKGVVMDFGTNIVDASNKPYKVIGSAEPFGGVDKLIATGNKAYDKSREPLMFDGMEGANLGRDILTDASGKLDNKYLGRNKASAKAMAEKLDMKYGKGKWIVKPIWGESSRAADRATNVDELFSITVNKSPDQYMAQPLYDIKESPITDRLFHRWAGTKDIDPDTVFKNPILSRVERSILGPAITKGWAGLNKLVGPEKSELMNRYMSPNKKGWSEYRVHALGDKVMPDMTYSRGFNLHGHFQTQGRDAKRAEEAVRRALSGKKFDANKYRNAQWGFDVVIDKDNVPHIIEANPSLPHSPSGQLMSPTGVEGYTAQLLGRQALAPAAMRAAKRTAAAGATAGVGGVGYGGYRLADNVLGDDE
jgi:hypothetical protein